MKVLIEVPHTGTYRDPFPLVFTHMVVATMQKGHSLQLEFRGHSLIYQAREEAAKKLLSEPDTDAILFLDSDMVPTPDMLTRLIEHDKPIVSALAFKRVKPYHPCIFKELRETDGTIYTDYPKGLIQVEACGMACCLIKREVFEKIPQPWYFPTPDLGEDLSFCLKTKQAGIPTYCDTTLICGHIGSYEVGEQHYLREKEASL